MVRMKTRVPVRDPMAITNADVDRPNSGVVW
jgi:L-lysine 2,3-aminomutase